MADEQEPEELEIDPLEEEEEELPPLTDEAEAYLAKEARRGEQGLGQFPFPDGAEPFQKIGDPKASYTVNDIKEVLRIVSSWYVKKANFYHDVTNLQVKYQPHDIKHLIVQRMRETFPAWKASEQAWKDFFKVLLDPPVNKLNPEMSIPVWSGKRVCLPSNPQKVFFRDGTATVNIWEKPAYRQLAGKPGSAFDEFIAYVIPKEQDREVFLNWLAWNLQNEGKKPSWAVMLYSEKQGTGKSTLTDLMKALFGDRNTGRTNGVGKLVGRFNKEILENKLVIVEEVEVKRGSAQANSLKSLITESSTMVEAKGLPAYVEHIYCAFIMTTNHLPLWLEESDRRFFILDFNHEGYANGGTDYTRFTKLVAELKSQIGAPEGIKGIYDNLMSRDVPDDFGSKLDVTAHSTEIMTRLRDLSPDVARQVIEEVLEQRGICFVPVAVASQIINKYAPREINSQTHLFSELGWKKLKLAWSGRPQTWVWVKIIDTDNPPRLGKVYVGDPSKTSKGLALGWVRMEEQVDAVSSLLGTNPEVLQGGTFKGLEHPGSGVDNER